MIEKNVPHLTREQFEESVKKDPEHPVAIVVLSGGLAYYQKDFQHFRFFSNFSRFGTPFLWGKNYPNVHYIVSYGLPDEPGTTNLNEGPSMEKFAMEVGFDPSRLHVTKASRNSFEEALAAQEILKVLRPRMTYVSTSAIHLPRVMGIYNKLGVAPVAFPAHYDTSPFTHDLRSFALSHAELLRQSLHELIGNVAYKLTGKM